MSLVQLIRTHIESWWHCRQRLGLVVHQLVRAGLHRHDPMFPLIREIALVPDRMLRLLLAIMGVVVLAVLAIALPITLLSSADHVTVYRQSSGDLLLIHAPSGTRSVPCPPEFFCLFIPKS